MSENRQDVAGHLREKKGRFYIVLNYKDSKNNRKTKWISTGLPVKGNKKRAEKMLSEVKRNFVIPEEKVSLIGSTAAESSRMLFADYMEEWVEMIKGDIRLTTYSGYKEHVFNVISPYFRKKGIVVSNLTAKDIHDFYTNQRLKGKAGSTIKAYHANIHKALKYAVKMDIIDKNPMDKVDAPKKERFVGCAYSLDELNELLEVSKGTTLELPVLLAGFYGFRRSEICGLRWSAIDFENKTITINHTISMPRIDGKTLLIAEDNAKTKTSLRTLPLSKTIEDKLLEKKAEQEEYRKYFRRSYNKKWKDYICVKPNGDLITPNYITSFFPKFLESKGLRKIRFHDLRHTCATLMQINDIGLNYIKEYLGHSDISTTANTYSHLDLKAMQKPVDKMESIIKI